MQTNNQRLGKYGEDSAAQFLANRGYQIIERNYRCPLGEIDIIARDGKWLVFVEVKTRSGGGYGHPFESITKEKLGRMRRLAAHWTTQNSFAGTQIRLDAVSVLLRGGRVLIEHLKQVF
jgi:putative endonuclease